MNCCHLRLLLTLYQAITLLFYTSRKIFSELLSKPDYQPVSIDLRVALLRCGASGRTRTDTPCGTGF